VILLWSSKPEIRVSILSISVTSSFFEAIEYPSPQASKR
jgi:hypothetical protein